MSLIARIEREPVGERIKRMREEKNMTQLELAKKINTSKQNISRYEKGVVETIPIRKLEAIAYALDTTYEYLTTGYDRLSDVVIHYDEAGNANIDEQSPLHELVELLQTISPDRYDLVKKILLLPPERLDALATLLNMEN